MGPGASTIVEGAVFVVCVLTFRRGIVGELGRFLKKPLQRNPRRRPQCGPSFIEAPPCGKMAALPQNP